ncbi:hypothetical protein JJJ17_13945 [Paracoccus caeni]|uniref:Uncharacterized protein n=1 Tax=Paracoccus caeni TaxID=657651 RepID=A0A934W1Q5_9RHOB|nr:hypothetical protein [Paracoccus caeni]MBK4217034.1 hypothetical protein [Paracoccus caeni]
MVGEIIDLEARKAYGSIYEAIIAASKEFGIDEEGATAIALRSLEILHERGRR